MPSHDLPFSLTIVLFGAEEIGLVGSQHYVDGLSPLDREQIVAMLNFDMVGVGDRPMIGGSDTLVKHVIEAAATDGTVVGRLGEDLNARSDHGSFLRAGIPAVFFHRSDDPNYHTANDQSSYVNADNLAVAGTLAIQLLTTIETLQPALQP